MFCEKCGAPYKQGSAWCGSCGSRIPTDKPEDASSPTAPSRSPIPPDLAAPAGNVSRSWKFGISLLVVLVLSGGAYWAYKNNSSLRQLASKVIPGMAKPAQESDAAVAPQMSGGTTASIPPAIQQTETSSSPGFSPTQSGYVLPAEESSVTTQAPATVVPPIAVSNAPQQPQRRAEMRPGASAEPPPARAIAAKPPEQILATPSELAPQPADHPAVNPARSDPEELHSRDPELKNVTLVARVLAGLSASSSKKGDKFSLQVLEPAAYKDAVIDGEVTKAKAAGKVSGKSELLFSFDRLAMKNGMTLPIYADLEEVFNSKGVAGVDEEGRVVGKSSVKKDVARTAVIAGIGALIGRIAGGGSGAVKGAAIGAAVGLTITFSTRGEDIAFSPGSKFKLVVNSKSDK